MPTLPSKSTKLPYEPTEKNIQAEAVPPWSIWEHYI